jgi:hypothetical protein
MNVEAKPEMVDRRGRGAAATASFNIGLLRREGMRNVAELYSAGTKGTNPRSAHHERFTHMEGAAPARGFEP